MKVAERFRNLLAVPSYHHHPVFAREVARAMRRFMPSAIALEVSADWAAEFQWGVSLWPAPVASFADGIILPVVPGDSMVEACRLGREGGLPISFIDCEPKTTLGARGSQRLPDAVFAPRVGRLLREAVDALLQTAGPPTAGDVAREAHMAAALAALMVTHDRVLWVGGMAHWARIRERLSRQVFDAPDIEQRPAPASFRRMRMEASALGRITARLPFQVADYARLPNGYEEARTLRRLALAAVKPDRLHAGEIAAMLVYARNLVAQESLRETPTLWELLTAASSVFGNEYAARLATLALEDQFPDTLQQYPALTHNIEAGPDGHSFDVYRCNGDVIAGEPCWTSPEYGFTYRRVPSVAEIERRKQNTPTREGKSADAAEKTGWAAHPDDEPSYEAFVRYVLNRATAPHEEAVPVPFENGLGDGIDIRATIQHWHSGDIYVRQPSRAPLRVTNGLIDFKGYSEEHWGPEAMQARMTGAQGSFKRGGWVDPSLLNVGSATWEERVPLEIQQEPFLIGIRQRELSLITLDAPTWFKSDEQRSFYTRVILRLVRLNQRGTGEDNLYGWLRIMFAFCRTKPFAYYSRYKPGPRIYALGRECGVRIIHLPLSRIPHRLLARHQTFRFMCLTRAQWNELQDRIAESKRAWTAAGGDIPRARG